MELIPILFQLNLVGPLITKQDTNMRNAISARDRLIVTIRFLATGDSYHSLQYLFYIPFNTISVIVPEVCDAIFNVLKEDYLKIPSTEDEWIQIANGFNEKWNFPNCIGSVDGKHVVMTAPMNSGSLFYNYKGTHSIVLMGIADAAYKFTYIDVGLNGRMSDGGVFRQTSFAQALASNKLRLPNDAPLPSREPPMPYLLIGDDPFGN